MVAGIPEATVGNRLSCDHSQTIELDAETNGASRWIEVRRGSYLADIWIEEGRLSSAIMGRRAALIVAGLQANYRAKKQRLGRGTRGVSGKHSSPRGT